MDVKSLTKRQPRRRAPGRRKNRSSLDLSWLRQPFQDTMVLRSGFSYGDIKSDTTGLIATTISPSFVSNFTEYSSVQNLYEQVRLLKCCLELTPKDVYDTTRISSRIDVGWNPALSYNTATAPTAITAVINLSNHQIVTTSKTTVTYCPGNPRNLVYTRISNADPAPDTGDCGSWIIYGGGLTPSITYFRAEVHAVFSFRGRN
jgi:hypothetical protein